MTGDQDCLLWWLHYTLPTDDAKLPLTILTVCQQGVGVQAQSGGPSEKAAWTHSTLSMHTIVGFAATLHDVQGRQRCWGR